MSACDLEKHGGRVYAADESTQILSLVAWVDGVYHLWTPHDCSKVSWPLGYGEDRWEWHIGAELPDVIAACTATHRFVAHNCDEFDACVWQSCITPVPSLWLDTLPLARCAGYPGALDRLSRLFLGRGKDKIATKVLMEVCKPRVVGGGKGRRGRKFNLEQEKALYVKPGELAIIASYNIADVIALRAIYEKVHTYVDPVYDTHRAINARGVRFDRDLAREIIRVSNEHTDRAGVEIERVTHGEITPKDLTRRDFIYKWVRRQGVNIDNLQRQTVQLLLDDPEAFYEEIMEGDDNEVYDTPEVPGEAAPNGAMRDLPTNVGVSSVQ